MRLDTYSKRQLQERAAEFYRRLQHTNPFPAMVAEGIVTDIKDPVFNTYMSCLPRHIRDAMLTLMADERYIGVLDTNNVSSLVVRYHSLKDSEKKIEVPIEFNFSKRRPSSIHWHHKAELDPEHPMRKEIIEWIDRAREVNQDYKRCRFYISTIVEWANTVGQLRTMFPDYVRLLPEYQQQHISRMQKRSALPIGVDEEFLKKHRQFVTEKTALCLLLPEGGEEIWV